MGSITLEAVEKWFGDVQIIKGIDLEIEDGEFVIFVGPSGCGKSTLLRMIAGLEDTSRGRILLDDEDVTDRVPSERALSMVFQSYALYPHMSVRDNVGFGLKTAGESKDEIARKVDHAASILELGPYLDRRPKALSGGQRQRVAMGRAIVREPAVFLFDEPLSNLDAKLRVQMRLEIRELQAKLGITSLYVTHDQVEAMTMADRMIVMNAGVAEQIGTPLEVYETPRTLFAAQFIGSPAMNILDARVENGRAIVADTVVADATGPDGPVKFGVRPEHMEPDEQGPLEVTILMTEPLGANTLLHGRLQGHPDSFTVSLPGVHALPHANTPMRFSVQKGQSHVFDPKTGLRRA